MQQSRYANALGPPALLCEALRAGPRVSPARVPRGSVLAALFHPEVPATPAKI